MPLHAGPEENEGRLYEYLLRRNRELTGLRFAIGVEDAVFLVAELPAQAVNEAEIDRLLGSFYAYSERWFRPPCVLAIRPASEGSEFQLISVDFNVKRV